MLIYVGTEFTDFNDCYLISIASWPTMATSSTASNPITTMRAAAPSCTRPVLPQLGQYPGRLLTRERLRAKLLA
jgi:hypothetical protein